MGGFLVKYVEGEPVSYLKGDFQGTINNLAEHWGVRAGEFVVTTHSGSVLNLGDMTDRPDIREIIFPEETCPLFAGERALCLR